MADSRSFPKNGLLLGMTLILLGSGCAEGPLWRSGKYVPWVQSQWAEEEKIADTLFSRKRRLTELAQQAANGPIEQQQQAAKTLREATQRRNPLLLRLHAVDLLGRINCPESLDALEQLSTARVSDIRLAAVNAWKNMPSEHAIPQLQRILGSDTDVDVRLAATRALSNFSGQQAVSAISLALADPDPALQLRAAESLEQVTGEQFGNNIVAWQNYVNGLQQR